MNVATKSALLLGATLALGVVIGLVGAGTLERQRRERLGGLGRPRGFARHIEEAIQPRDAAQAAQVRAIIERAAERNQRMIRGANDALRRSVDSLTSELQPLLDEPQRRRLAEATRGLPPLGGPPGGRGGRPGPPPFGPPRDGGPPIPP